MLGFGRSLCSESSMLDPLYENGAKEFLDFASLDRPDASAILCPCRKCRNMKFVRKDLIVEQIVVDGFLTSYTSWIYHGEELFSSKLVNQLDKGDDHEMQDMLHEALGIPPTSFVDMDTSAEGFDGSNQHNMGFDKKTEEFFLLLKEVERELSWKQVFTTFVPCSSITLKVSQWME
ncbi:hypothetical protein KY290_036564 [Solanum tuberosum]|uniref:Transposase-associated domain-containing protein n=1 Tax=Solanum tuberosum TaxID=4113 RepID=A0ABQ7TT09_SOLTU|nr:hypothetical protein KY285_035878 [Solanum tuberosum]KAH0737859.1 hypothetical protein KY290_036564 [Solanum tuberosum]